MKHTKLATLAAVAALSGVAAIAGAQTNGPLGISVRAGVMLPTNDDAFSTAFAAGIDYKLRNFSLRSPGEGLQSYLGLSADYYGDGDHNNIPVALTYNVRSGSIVYHAGIGIDFHAGDDTGTSLGGQVGIAYEFGNAGRANNPLFLQAKYFITDKSELSGFGLYLGYRF